jgi:hypothetical protein
VRSRKQAIKDQIGRNRMIEYCMKKLLLLLIGLFSILTSIGQGFDDRHPEVESYVNSVNSKLISYRKVVIENEDWMEQMTDGGGKLTGYFFEGTIQKMELWVGLSYGVNRFEFFYKNAELFSVIETFDQYEYDEEKGGFNYSKTEQTFSGVYLFMDVFDYQTTGQNRFEDDKVDPEKVLRDEANSYYKLLKDKLN